LNLAAGDLSAAIFWFFLIKNLALAISQLFAVKKNGRNLSRQICLKLAIFKP
jgi:hypothetical protein